MIIYHEILYKIDHYLHSLKIIKYGLFYFKSAGLKLMDDTKLQLVD